LSQTDADVAAAPAPSATSVLSGLVRQLRPALAGMVVLTLLTGVLYPALIYGIGRAAFPDQADGSLVKRGGVVVGSRLIGQGFARPEYFQSRPSAAGNGYDATQSSGTNLAPGNPKLIAAVGQAAADYRKLNRIAAGTPVPIDAVTSSGSGLDPEISPENAALQVPRIAAARCPVASRCVRPILDLVAAHTRGRDLGVLGQPRVEVLELNLALDRALPMRRP
jgi:K+-transporting ATPase ATPase C chain